MEWRKIYAINDIVQANLVNAVLHENGIETRILNHRDSAIVSLGEIEIYVQDNDVKKAQEILESDETIKSEESNGQMDS